MFEEWYLPAFTSVSLQPLIHILTLADKYAIEKIRQPFASNVEALWPANLKQWDLRERRVEVIQRNNLLDPSPTVHLPRQSDLLPEPASAIRFARQFGVSAILPGAFYHLSRMSIPDNWDELERPTSAVRWQLLSAQDLLCLMRGQKLLHRTTIDALHINSFPECSSQPSCNVTGLSDEIVDSLLHSGDILRCTRHYLDKLSNSGKLCSACSLEIREHLTSFREGFWERLPNFFSPPLDC